mmetsp:Transcript_126874/g.359011  ORF Transcript_126874/g.359011 Transcript_126874/m.359011 type:complete len:202 (-) Transcript_126874:534-1139(-)
MATEPARSRVRRPTRSMSTHETPVRTTRIPKATTAIALAGLMPACSQIVPVYMSTALQPVNCWKTRRPTPMTRDFLQLFRPPPPAAGASPGAGAPAARSSSSSASTPPRRSFLRLAAASSRSPRPASHLGDSGASARKGSAHARRPARRAMCRHWPNSCPWLLSTNTNVPRALAKQIPLTIASWFAAPRAPRSSLVAISPM